MKVKLDPRKSFIVKIAIGTGIVLLLWGYSADMREGSRKLVFSNEQLAREIEEKKSKFIGAEGVNIARNKMLRENLLPVLKQQLEFPDTLESVPKETDSAVHLRQILSESQRELRDNAARKSLIIPEKEWDIANRIKKENTAWEISELRLRLCATQKILATCVEGGVARVLSVSQGQTVLEEIENSPYSIVRFPITVQIDSDLRSLSNLLLTFQKSGNFIEVRSLSVKSKSESEPMLSSQIEFAVVRLDEAVRLAGEIEAKPQPGSEERAPVRVPRRKY